MRQPRSAFRSTRRTAGRLGGVDEELIREGRLKPLTDPRALELHKREDGSGSRVRRDPAVLLELLLSARDEAA